MSNNSTRPGRLSGGVLRVILLLSGMFAVALLFGLYRSGPNRSGVAIRPPDDIPMAPASGHSNLTLDESGLSADPDGERLTFATLEAWRFSPENPDEAPEAVRRLDGRPQRLSGFMFPLESGTTLRNFCLLKTTQTCCYGPMPQFNQYVLVEMDQPVAFTAARPVTVTGRFHVDPQPEEGFIYRMEGVGLSAAPVDALRVVAR